LRLLLSIPVKVPLTTLSMRYMLASRMIASNVSFCPQWGIGPSLALRVGKQDRYLAFAAEYWAAIVHGNIPVERINPDQRTARMRESFERDKSVLAADYAYFTTPRESIHPNKVEHKSAERNGRQSPEQSEKLSSDKSDD
jgi:hypothetical protein